MSEAMWTLALALNLVRDVQAAVKPFGYHVALGGGCLNNGMSNKDVDLYFLPLADATDHLALLAFLSRQWGYPELINTNELQYGPDKHYRAKLKYRSLQRRIDAFIV